MNRTDGNDMQRLNFAIQAAMRAVQTKGMGGQEWPNQQSEDQGSEGRLDEVRTRVKEAVRTRFAQRMQERLAETVKERVREVLRDRLATELRGAVLEAQSSRGFDFSRLEKRLGDRLSETIHERVIDALRHRARDTVRERLADSIRESITGCGIAGEERLATRNRQRPEPEIADSPVPRAHGQQRGIHL